MNAFIQKLTAMHLISSVALGEFSSQMFSQFISSKLPTFDTPKLLTPLEIYSNGYFGI